MISGSQIPIVNSPEISVPDYKSPFATALQSAMGTYGSLQNIESTGYKNLIDKAKAQYAQPMAQADLKQAQALPQKTLAEATYDNALAKGVPAESALKQAQAAQAWEDVKKSQAILPYAGQTAQADIEEKKAQANYYLHGGGRAGTQIQQQRNVEDLILGDNPHITDPIKQREAINVAMSGGAQLADGTPVNPMSPETQYAYDGYIKSTHTAQLVNQNVQANQASAELVPVNQAIKEGVYDTGYGTTVLGVSPKQIKDAADIGNHEAQKRIGDYLAAQTLLYDKAALMLKINGLPAGQRIATKISDLSAQTIKAKYPLMSAEARQNAADKVGKVLEQILQARNAYGISVSKGLQAGQNPAPAAAAPSAKWIRQNGQFVRVS